MAGPNGSRGSGFRLKDCPRCGFTFHERELKRDNSGLEVDRECFDSAQKDLSESTIF